MVHCAGASDANGLDSTGSATAAEIEPGKALPNKDKFDIVEDDEFA